MKQTAKRPFAIWTIALLTAAFCGRAVADGPDYSNGMLDRKAALEAAKAVSTNRYPDADEVVVAAMSRIDYNADGTYTEWEEEYAKILTEKGRRGYLTVSTHFTIPYQRGPEDCRIPRLEIVKPDGSLVPVDVESNSRIMINPGSMAANIYNPNDKVIQVNVAGLEVGDVVHCVMFDRIVQPRMRDTWCEWFVLEGTSPIVLQVIEVSAPKERPLRSIMLKDEIRGTVTSMQREDGDRIRYRWEARDVPRMFPEPNMPPLDTVVQRLLVSTAPDWQTVSRWYWKISEPHYATTAAMQAQVAALTRGIEEPRGKMEAIFRFVAQQIRYMGITAETTSPGHEPHDVKDTFEARHGVCRDKAALLVAMLRLAGFEAFPVLIDTTTKKDAEVPQPYFNHAITAVREAPGRYLLMDSTDETASEFLPAYLNDKSYLVATPEGDILRTTPIDPAERNLMRIRTEGLVDEDGRLSAETVLQFEGVNDNVYRAWFSKAKPEDRRRFFEGLMKTAVPGARVTAEELLPADIMDVSTPLTARLRLEAEDVRVRARGLTLLPLPTLGTQLGMVNMIIGQTGLKERKYPLLTDVACGVRESIALDLPADMAKPEFLPSAEPVDTNTVSWAFDVRQTNTTLTADADFRLKVTEFKPGDYRDLKETLKKIERDLRGMPGYRTEEDAQERLTQGADAVVMDETTEYTLADAHNWTERHSVRKQILTYAGKKHNSEIKLAYNTAWEDVRLDRAVVTAADGAVREISTKEINVMDAPWVGSACRYPPGKILVASFPAVEIGSTIDYTYTRVCKGRPFFASQESFRYFDALARKTVRVSAPRGVALRVEPFKLEGTPVRAAVREAGGTNIFEWTAANVPPVRREEMLPPWWTFNPTVFVSAGSWPEYAKIVGRAMKKASAGQTEAARKALAVVGAERDPLRRVRRLRDYVALHVRESGPSLDELPLDAITPADRTLADGYGNSADRAVLLAAMLKAAGVRTEFVLVSAAPLIAPLAGQVRRMPDPAFFGEALVRVRDRRARLAAGADVYLNDTDEYAPIGASSHGGQCGLALPGGEIAGIWPADKDEGAVTCRLTVAGNGDTTLARTEAFYGNACGVEHKLFAEMTPEERRRYHQEMIAVVSQAAEARGNLATDFTENGGRVSFAVWIPRYAVRNGRYLTVDLPGAMEAPFILKADSRINPLYQTRLQNRGVELVVTAPEGFRLVHMPEGLGSWARDDAEGTGVEAALTATGVESSNTVTVTVAASGSIVPALVDPKRYPALLDLDRALSHQRNRTVVFEQTEVPSGAK